MEISGVTNGSWLCPEPWCFHFFSDSSFLCLYTHSLCFAINQLLHFALSLAYLSHIIISSRFVITSTKLLLSSFKSVYNLHNFICPFILYLFMYPYTQQSTFIYYTTFKSMPPISFPFLFYSHLFLSITNLIILPSLFTLSFRLLLIFFNHRLSLHSLLHTTQSHSHYFLHTLHSY